MRRGEAHRISHSLRCGQGKERVGRALGSSPPVSRVGVEWAGAWLLCTEQAPSLEAPWPLL